jgi:hypothetical protein
MLQNYTTTIIKILLVLGVVGVLFVTFLRNDAVGTTFATGSGTGGLELKIDNKTFYNGVLQPKLSWIIKNLQPWCDFFFDFDDIKPGDTGTTTISIHIKQNPAWVCLDFENLKDKENGRNEPERLLDNNGKGELSKELEFFAWRDDGDNKFEIGEKPLFGTSTQSAVQVLNNKSYALADFKNGPAYQPNKTKYVGINWCAGNLNVDLATAKVTCDASAMGNEAQTDGMSLDVSIRAVSSKQQPKFTCNNTTGHGNNGHGNDDDHNDDSNPGHSNDDDDHSDDDGFPGNHGWSKVDKKPWSNFKDNCVSAWDKVKNYRRA